VGISERRACLLEGCLGLSLPGASHVAPRLGSLIASLYFVKLLRADGLLFIKSLIALESRLRQREFGFRDRDLLLRRQIRRRRAVESGAGLTFVNHCQYLTAPDEVAFMHTDLDEIPHHLGSELAGLRSAECAHGFHQIGNLR
jgi:hypothetical protein